MDIIEKYKIQASVEDTLRILDSAPIQPDMMPETNIMQLTNRMPIAHLGIERGLKVLISEAGGTADKIHDLDEHFKSLANCDKQSTDFLSDAFDDAVKFYGYNPRRKGFTQFASISVYLSRVGTAKAFEALRYWAIGEVGKGENPIALISPAIHRELLCATHCLFMSDGRETISQRVDREIFSAMGERRRLHWVEGDRERKESIEWYFNWLLNSNGNLRQSLRDAVLCNFEVRDNDQFIKETISEAWGDLQTSKDPAVQYFLYILKYLPEGSQSEDPVAIADVDWLNPGHSRGKVVTPAGACLGFIEKFPDGAWGIISLGGSSATTAPAAWKLKDAVNHLVEHRSVSVLVDFNGKRHELRITGDGTFHPRPIWGRSREVSRNLRNQGCSYELEFWDNEHGLTEGDSVTVIGIPKEGSRFATVLEGMVTFVDEQNVTIAGSDKLDAWHPDDR